MRAVWLERHVGPEAIRVGDVVRPALHGDDVLVRVNAAGVNPSDISYAGGRGPSALLPRIPGRDFAGVIVECKSELLIGQEVYGTGGDLGIKRHGTHAEYVEIPGDGYALKPHALTMQQAAAVGVPYITAYKAIVTLAQLLQGETILILGGSGAVGGAAAQIAKWLGASVIGTARRSDPSGSWKKYLDTQITVPDEDIPGTVMSLTGERGVDVVFNAAGGVVFEDGVKSLGRGGRMVCISAQGEQRVSFDLMNFYKREMRWHGLDTLELTASDCAPILTHLAPGFESGAFNVEIAHVFPLEQASEAYRLVAQGGAGKVILAMGA